MRGRIRTGALFKCSTFIPRNPTRLYSSPRKGICKISSPRSTQPDSRGSSGPYPLSREAEPKYFIAHASVRLKSSSSNSSLWENRTHGVQSRRTTIVLSLAGKSFIVQRSPTTGSGFRWGLLEFREIRDRGHTESPHSTLLPSQQLASPELPLSQDRLRYSPRSMRFTHGVEVQARYPRGT